MPTPTHPCTNIPTQVKFDSDFLWVVIGISIVYLIVIVSIRLPPCTQLHKHVRVRASAHTHPPMRVHMRTQRSHARPCTNSYVTRAHTRAYALDPVYYLGAELRRSVHYTRCVVHTHAKDVPALRSAYAHRIITSWDVAFHQKSQPAHFDNATQNTTATQTTNEKPGKCSIKKWTNFMNE